MTDHDEDHYDALGNTGFWGRQGAGCLVYAKSTRRYLLQLRSGSVLEPYTWGVWGGAVDPGLSDEESALAELAQEAGYVGDVDLRFLVDFKDEESGFRYRNFLAVVEHEFDPILNWEGESFGWFECGAWPEPLHFGMEYLLDRRPDPAAAAGVTVHRPLSR